MPKLYDANGDECQMTGLPAVFYEKTAVDEEMRRRDAHIAELEATLQSCVFAMLKQREAIHQWDRTVTGVVEEAQKQLALRSTT